MSNFNPSYTGIRYDLLKHIHGKNMSVMDVGCANGANGKYLIEKKNASIVVGVEAHKDMAIEASKIYSKVFQGDLNNLNFLKTISNESQKFDFIIFGDVLEHLISPEKVMKEIINKLKPNGKVIISLPNIAHMELFIQVYVKGTWPKNRRGIFDETHLRWFTRKDAFQMVENCNLRVIKYERNLRFRDEKESFDWRYKIFKFLNIDWVTFQHILICGNE